MTDTKQARLRDLAGRRQRERWPGYTCVGDFHDGAYECDHVSPYTKSAGNVDASVVVMLQDWSSADFLSKDWSESSAVLGREPSLPTNRTLDRLLHEHLALDIGDIYATNLFPFIKPGGITSDIRMSELRRAAREYGWPQIEIVAPRLVIALGLNVYRALAQEAGHARAPNLPAAIAAPRDVNGVRLWCQAHTGSRGQNNRRRVGADAVERDWASMGEWLRSAGQP